jgi:D-alanyl-D-alanine carboxypeptidase
MSNGNQHRNRSRQRSGKKYRLRYDRVVAAVLVLIVLIVILTSCVNSCSKGKKKSKDNDTTTSTNAVQSSIVDNLRTSGKTAAILSSDGSSTTAPQYTNETHSKEDVYRGSLVLVNANNEYRFPVDDAEPLTIYNNKTNDCYDVCDYVTMLDKEALSHLDALMKGFYDATKNTDVTVIGGYRTLEQQNDKYNNGYSSFKGGFSDYHAARSFDMGVFPKDGSSSGYYSPTGIYSWIDENAADYGFIVRFPEGKESFTGEQARTQTYRYVGTPHSVYIKQNDLCLEEYIDKLKTYNINAPLEITSGKTVYQVYYVPAVSGGSTEVPVPSNKVYWVSGNNSDGFIVTVSLN